MTITIKVGRQRYFLLGKKTYCDTTNIWAVYVQHLFQFRVGKRDF